VAVLIKLFVNRAAASVKLGKRFGRIGFLLGFVGPLLFYSLHYEVTVLCPLYPHVDPAFAHPLLWLQIGLMAGLTQGLVFAIAGFAMGYAISRVKTFNLIFKAVHDLID
jgi:hypothetical protein